MQAELVVKKEGEALALLPALISNGYTVTIEKSRREDNSVRYIVAVADEANKEKFITTVATRQLLDELKQREGVSWGVVEQSMVMVVPLE
jgi:hypothetical protein